MWFRFKMWYLQMLMNARDHWQLPDIDDEDEIW